ncbi:hypothetical protein ACFL0Z_01610 [Patescibacteria group bacterium]
MQNKAISLALALVLVFLLGLTGLISNVPEAQAASVADRLSGRILLQVEANGEAWYVSPINKLRYYMKDGADALQIMRGLGEGISNANLARIPLSTTSGGDTTFAERFSGQILLQTESNGEAWYVSPVNLRRYALGGPDEAYLLMRNLGLGATNTNLDQIFSAENPINIIHRYYGAINSEDYRLAYDYCVHEDHTYTFPDGSEGGVEGRGDYCPCNFDNVIHVFLTLIKLHETKSDNYKVYKVSGEYDFTSNVIYEDGMNTFFFTMVKEDGFWRVGTITSGP